MSPKIAAAEAWEAGKVIHHEWESLLRLNVNMQPLLRSELNGKGVALATVTALSAQGMTLLCLFVAEPSTFKWKEGGGDPGYCGGRNSSGNKGITSLLVVMVSWPSSTPLKSVMSINKVPDCG